MTGEKMSNNEPPSLTAIIIGMINLGIRKFRNRKAKPDTNEVVKKVSGIISPSVFMAASSAQAAAASVIAHQKMKEARRKAEFFRAELEGGKDDE
jgi:hypothetical protein